MTFSGEHQGPPNRTPGPLSTMALVFFTAWASYVVTHVGSLS